MMPTAICGSAVLVDYRIARKLNFDGDDVLADLQAVARLRRCP
jgi:hypothetical protein